MAELHVEVVAAEGRVWSGAASLIVARTTEGEIGIMPGHESVLALLASGPVLIHTVDSSGSAAGSGETVRAAVHGGFLTVADDNVSVLTEVAERAEDIDRQRAEQARDRADTDGDEDARRRAETRLLVAGQAAGPHVSSSAAGAPATGAGAR